MTTKCKHADGSDPEAEKTMLDRALLAQLVKFKRRPNMGSQKYINVKFPVFESSTAVVEEIYAEQFRGKGSWCLQLF